MAKIISAKPVAHTKTAVDRLFQVMNLMAWFSLAVGVITTLLSITNFTDTNASLMVGIGFMVGSVFIYICGAALHLVSEKIEGSSSDDK